METPDLTAAHKLKSAAGNVGASRVHAIAAQLVVLARTASTADAALLSGALDTALADAETALARETALPAA